MTPQQKKSIKLLREYLATPEGKQSLIDFHDDIALKTQEQKNFFETEEFNNIFNKIVDAIELDPLRMIQGNDYYDNVADNITDEEFHRVSASVMAFEELRIEENVEMYPFYNQCYLYKGIVFMLVQGQGCFTRAYKYSDYKLEEEQN